MSPVASFLFLAAPMASLVTVMHLKRDRKAAPRGSEERLMQVAPEALELPEPTSSSEAWQAAIGGMIGEDDHSPALAEHYRKPKAQPAKKPH